MTKLSDMLQLYRRHSRTCPHRKKGRTYTKCKCTIHADGELGGSRFRRSTSVRDRQRALRKIAAWESPNAPTLKPVSEATAAFLLHCRDLSDATKLKYRNVMKQFESFCQRESITHLGELSVEALDGYRASRQIGRLTAVKELQTLRQFCGFCLDRGWLTENLATRIKPPQNIKPGVVEPYTPAEVAQFLFACDNFGRSSYERLRARAMLLLLRCTGLRISDVATLARDRVRDGGIFLHTVKSGGQVMLPVPVELQAALDSVPPPRDARADCPYYLGIIRNA